MMRLDEKLGTQVTEKMRNTDEKEAVDTETGKIEDADNWEAVDTGNGEDGEHR